ncbi:hypothetical protein ABXS71_10560 [Bacillus infantis]|uniref:hypothetical protein n=1 Tax=Bacillus infantis TaxID=324767 RepID=UPI00344F66CA
MKKCLYCQAAGNLFPLKEWNRERTNYYCSKHYDQVLKFQNKEQREFFDYFRQHPKLLKYLSSKSLELYKRLEKEYSKGGQHDNSDS